MKRPRGFAVIAVALFVALADCGAVTSNGPSVADSSTAQSTASPTPEPVSTDSGELSTPNGTFEVHFINVGQGASTIVIGPSNETMLIDTGDWTDDCEEVLSYLEKHGVDRIDYLVTTHADADHIGGHAAVIDHFETQGEGVGAVYDPGIASSSQTYARYLDAIEEHGVKLYETRAGDSIPLDGVETRVLLPPEGYLAGEERNENSIALHLRFGESRFLLPGDIENDGEEYLVEEFRAGLNATVLQAGHHGSQSSSSSELLDETQPRVAVISSGYDSQYGHPHEEVLQRFSNRSIATYWTATHGTVRMVSNGSAITVATQRNAPTAPLDVRTANAIEPGTTDDVEVRTVIDPNGTAMPVAADGGSTPSTPSSTATGTDAGETSGGDGLGVAAIHEDAAGDESANLNDEYIVFENTGDTSIDLSGWTVRDAADHTYQFPSGFTLDPGAQVTLHTGSGGDSATNLYWELGTPVWNNDGDTVIVENDSGTIVLEEEY